MSSLPYTEVVASADDDTAADIQPQEAESATEQPPARKWYGGGGMGKRILGVVVFLLALGLLWYAYQRHLLQQANEGAITIDDGVSKAADASTDMPTPKKSAAPSVTSPAPTTTSAATPAVIPATDSIAPNPTNGMTFAGTGKFQVYRQGNLTWRVDTESGHTCILFATMEEWRKPIVFQHGCANS